MIALWWISKSGNIIDGQIPMGEYATPKDAERAIPGALVELLDQCGSEQERDAIEAGTWMTGL